MHVLTISVIKCLVGGQLRCESVHVPVETGKQTRRLPHQFHCNKEKVTFVNILLQTIFSNFVASFNSFFLLEATFVIS